MPTDPTDLTKFPIGQTGDFNVADRNARDFDTLVNGGDTTVTNRAGNSLNSYERELSLLRQTLGALNNTGDWVTATNYNANDLWRHTGTGVVYLVLRDYTSGATEADDIALSPIAVQVYQSSGGEQGVGPTRPSTVVANNIWFQTVSATEVRMQFYDGTDDILTATYNPTTNTVTYAGVVSQDSSTGAAQLPVGTTAQAPTAQSGLVRANSDRNEAEFAIGSNYHDIINQRVATAGGTVDAITVTNTRPVLVLEDNLPITVIASGASTVSNPTINVDGLGARTIVKDGNQSLAIGDIPRAGFIMQLVYRSTNNNFELINPPSGASIIQKVRTTISTPATTTVNIPLDNTIPQITEGMEAATVTITPTSASSTLEIRAVIYVAAAGLSRVAGALFQDSTADAFATGSVTSNGNFVQPVVVEDEITAGTASATTFRIRFGAASGTAYLNSGNGSAEYGGTYASFIEVREVAS